LSTTGIVVQPGKGEQKPNPFKIAAEALSSESMAVLVLASPEEYERAAQRFRNHSAVTKKVEEFYDPKVEAARVPYKALLDERKEVLDVLERSKKHTAKLMTVYEQEQARIAREEQARIEKQQKEEADRLEKQRLESVRVEEDNRIEAAEALEEAGLHDAAAALLDTPVVVPEPVQTLPPPVAVVAPAIPVVKGVSGRANWKGRLCPTGGPEWPAEVSEDDLMKAMVELCKAIGEGKVPPMAVTLNNSFVNKQAGSMKKKLAYPGVEVYDDKIRVGRS
jgi:uncharacterized protein YdcH (DUF465 family)